MFLYAEYLLRLMKQQIDELLAQDQQLQAFLTWVSQKARATPSDQKSVTVRAFYFDLALARALDLIGGTLDLARAFNRTLTCNIERNLALDLALDRALAFERVVELIRDPKLAFESVLERALAHARAVDPDLERAMQRLKQQVPSLGSDGARFKKWWSAHGEAWTEQLRAMMVEHRDLGYNWQFSTRQGEALLQYYNANSTLVDCLNSNYYVTPTMREEIEKTLLLPIAEISQLTAARYS